MATTQTTEKVHVYENQGNLIVNPGVAKIGGRYPGQIKFFNDTGLALVVNIPGGLTQSGGGPIEVQLRPHTASEPYTPVAKDLAVVYTVSDGKRKGIGGSDPVIIIDT